MGRKAKSKYDQYSMYITDCRNAGMTLTEIESKLIEVMPDSTAAGINYFCQSRGIPSPISQGCKGERNKLPHCDKCSGCMRFQDKKGYKRACLRLMMIIPAETKTSLMECPERKI